MKRKFIQVKPEQRCSYTLDRAFREMMAKKKRKK